jgi:hypothetical protein
MRQLYNIQKVQTAQKHMHEPLVTRQEMPKHASYTGEVQKKHRVLNGGTPHSQHKSKHEKRHKARKTQIHPTKPTTLQASYRQLNQNNRGRKHRHFMPPRAL